MTAKRKAVRPVTVTVFAILSIVFGTVNVITVSVSLIMSSDSTSLFAPDYPALFNHYNNISTIILNALLIIVGFLLIKFHPSSKKIFIYLNIIDIINSLAVKGFMLLYALQLDDSEFDKMVFGIVLAVVSFVISLIFPSAALIFMTRKKVREAYEQRQAECDAQSPV